jgi:hypothetical protein
VTILFLFAPEAIGRKLKKTAHNKRASPRKNSTGEKTGPTGNRQQTTANSQQTTANSQTGNIQQPIQARLRNKNQ